MSFIQAEQQCYPWIKDLVHKLKWTYGALWTLNTAEGPRSLRRLDVVQSVAKWEAGWYKCSRTLDGGNDNIIQDESRIEALFYSSYKSCSFQHGFGYVGLVLVKQQSIWLTGNQEVLEHAVLTQALFLKTAGIKTVICIPYTNNVLELGKFEEESRDDRLLHQIQRWLSCVTYSPLNTQPSPAGGVVSDVVHDGGSCEAMHMSSSLVSSIFSDDTNVNINFGPLQSSTSDFFFKQQQRKNNQDTTTFSNSTSASSDARMSMVLNSFGTYPPPLQHSTAHGAIPLLGDKQERPSQRVQSWLTGHETSSSEMGTSFAQDWRGAADVAGASGVFPRVINVYKSDTIITCSGMAAMSDTSSSLLSANKSFSQQQQQHGHAADPKAGVVGDGISLDHTLLTLPPAVTMPPEIISPRSLPLAVDILQDSTNLLGLPSKNSGDHEWPPLEPSTLDEFVDDENLQRLRSPDNVLILAAIAAGSAETGGDWFGTPTGTTSTSDDQTHHHYFDVDQQQRTIQQGQYEFPDIQGPIVNNLQQKYLSNPRPALASLTTQQQQRIQQQRKLISHAQQLQSPRWPLNNSAAWVRWVARKQSTALRYKPRDSSGASHAAVLRMNQTILKKLLTELVPRIAKEQKAREEKVIAQAVETETWSHRIQMLSSYPTTTAKRQESGSIQQDPQARTHMLAERRRRVRENEHYSALRKLIPPTSRMDKATVLAETIQLVKRLKKKMRQLEKVNPEDKRTPNLSVETSGDSQIGNTSQSSRGDPGSPSPGRGSGSSKSDPDERNPLCPKPDLASPASATPSHDDNNEICEVNTLECHENQLRAKIRTSHSPDTIIKILICLKDHGLEVLSTCVSVEKNWVHADFQLQMNAVHSSRVSRFIQELQEALQRAIFPEKSITDSTFEGGSITPGVVKS